MPEKISYILDKKLDKILWKLNLKDGVKVNFFFNILKA